MTFQEYKDSLQNDAPPAGLNRALQALWYAGKSEWDQAHDLTQEAGDRDVDWVHAWLHRDEGDLSNANYWYNRAGRTMSNQSLQEEWDAIARELLGEGA